MPNQHKHRTLPLSLAALGIVYGDLGTSPLYALKQISMNLSINSIHILGALSLIFWALILVVSIQYITLFLKVDNEGEGGILALVSLLKRQRKKFPRFLFILGLLGAGLLLGDGMITPAISVISAIEGLQLISPQLAHFIMPIAFVILLFLFLLQHFGTGRIGLSFGPIILGWFITIGILGAASIIHHPEVLVAVNPYYAFMFFSTGGWHAYLLLSGVFLVLTGAEAMYADLGHFGKRPIRLSWYCIVLPSLLLNYFGQGAILLHNPEAVINPFYALAPTWFIYPLIILASLATIIASQAVIAASFSLVRQGILLQVCPRLSILHTSKEECGQVYIPQINTILCIGTLLLVAIFKTSQALAAAFGTAVNLVMLIVTILIITVARFNWRWSFIKIILVFGLFILIDLSFLGANLHKIEQGAWIPLVFAACVGIVMITWENGLKFLRSSYYMSKRSLSETLSELDHSKLCYLEDLITVFITEPYDKSGGSFLRYLELNKIMPKQALIVSFVVENYPFIPEKKRYDLQKLSKGIYVLTLSYGFMQTINIPRTLQHACEAKFLPFSLLPEKTVYLVETINLELANKKPHHLYYWQKKLFSFLLQNSKFDIEFFKLPMDRTIAIGTYFKI
jgi:KUP system potassium uptake protein